MAKKQRATVSLPQVYRGMSWTELFGRSVHDTTHEDRRARWEQAKGIADSDELLTLRSYESCEHRGCEHFNAGWCEWSGLPSGFNPVLRCYGMACMGCGYQPQRTLFGKEAP